ncbi:MAG: glutamate formimidoyltransferase [Bacteroidales bacterium]|nr:glutamate formimidoyltransferase [Bacteroidales bacterium]
MKRIIECVPNFSEGRNREVIDKIVAAIAAVKVNVDGRQESVKVLDVDPGEATNRTVVTFVGSPEAVLEAAFQGVKKAAELIDMRLHKGAHPRSGATDVLPLIPVSGITLEECAELARGLAKRIFDEQQIPCYCYEAAAFKPERKNLAVCRAGEYEALPEKVVDPERKPDFGPGEYTDVVAKSGAINVGARNFLVAVNFNLNTTSTRRAMAVAFDVREKGRKMREGGSLTGKVLRDENGKEMWQPGTLKGCKAIGWYIDEYGIAQVSMNITDIEATSLHKAYEEVCRAASARGLKVTGTEIVGLVPKRVLIDAGKFYLEKQQRSLGIAEDEILKIAVKSMSLDDLKPFNPHEKVIEYLMEDPKEMAVKERLIRMTCKDFAVETASESPAPGGGSISAYMGALGAALSTMVANLSSHKRGWDDRWKEFSDWAEKGNALMNELLSLVDEDTAAFNKIMDVFAMPKGTEEEKAARAQAMEDATLYATQVPLRTLKTAAKVFEVAEQMASKGNPNSVSDAGVAAIAARGAVMGARLNVHINAEGLKDRMKAEELMNEADRIMAQAVADEKRILEIVENTIKG